MPRRPVSAYWQQLLISFRAMCADGGEPNYSRAGAEAGCSRETAKKCWNTPQPSTATRGPLPAICDVIAAERAGAAPYDPDEPAVRSPGADSAAAAPVPPAAASVAVGPTDVSPAAVPPPTAAAAVRAPDLLAPEDPEVAEARLVRTARIAAEGLARQTVQLCLALQPMVAATRRSLAATAEGGLADPKFVMEATASLAKSLTQTAAAIERLAGVQNILSNRPHQTIRVAHDAPPAPALTEAQVRQQAEVVMDVLVKRARELEAEEVGPAAAPARLGAIPEAEVVS